MDESARSRSSSIATWRSEDPSHSFAANGYLDEGGSFALMTSILTLDDLPSVTEERGAMLPTSGLPPVLPPSSLTMVNDVRASREHHQPRPIMALPPTPLTVDSATAVMHERDLLAASIETLDETARLQDQMTNHFSDMAISLTTVNNSFDHVIDQMNGFIGDIPVTSGLAYPNLVGPTAKDRDLAISSTSFVDAVSNNPNNAERQPQPAASSRSMGGAEDSFDALVSSVTDAPTRDVTEHTSLVAYPNLVGSQRSDDSLLSLRDPLVSGVSSTQEQQLQDSMMSFMSVGTLSIAATTRDEASVAPSYAPTTNLSTAPVFTNHDIIIDGSDVPPTRYPMGNHVYYSELKRRHEEYIRAMSDVDKSDMRLALIKLFGQMGYRFWKQNIYGQWGPMSEVEIERDMCRFLSQKCYVDGNSAYVSALVNYSHRAFTESLSWYLIRDELLLSFDSFRTWFFDIALTLSFRLDKDVRMGRGGHCTNNPGNQRFLNKKDEMQPAYSAAGRDNETKRHISQELVDWVYASGGRFVDECDSRWYIVSNEKARIKAQQALREVRKRTTTR